MFYDLSIPLHRDQFLSRAQTLVKKGSLVELKDKSQRTIRQNSYLHALLGYFALRYGETLEYTKMVFFKAKANPSTFLVWKENEIRGKYQTLRSTKDLTTEELSQCIERFRDWSAKEAGIYLPSASDHEAIRQMELEISRSQQYI